MKQFERICLIILILLGIVATYKVTSLIFIEKPVIESIGQSTILADTNMDGGINLSLLGKNLNDIVCVYINGEWVKNIDINSVSDEEIRIVLPAKYYQGVGENTLKIKLEKKINSDKTVFSNTAHLHISKNDSLVKPVITNTNPQVLELGNTSNRILKIVGRNFKKECKAIINDKEYDTNYIDESTIEVTFPYSDWCEKDNISIKVSQQSSDKDTMVYNLTSEEFTVEVNGKMDSQDLNYNWVEQNRYIAHAFGIYNEKTYTNSLEAFQLNYEKGFRVFEVDMSFTSDNVLILKHDWGRGGLNGTDFKKSSLNNLPKTFDEIKTATGGYTLLNFDELCKLMTEYPDIYIVTDTKDTDSVGINEIFRYMVEHAKMINESVLDRLIIQIYNEQMYYEIMNIYNFKSIIYTLYYNNNTPDQILSFVEKTGIKVVTMFDGKFGDQMYDFIKKLNDIYVYVYVHTINDTDTVSRLLQTGVYGFYTDSLSIDENIDMDAERNKFFNRPDFKSITSISDYIYEINRYHDMVMILSVKDDASEGMSEDLQKLLYDCGANETLQDSFRAGYILISNNGQAIFEEKSLESKVKYENVIDESHFTVTSGGYESGDISQIIIDDIDYSPNFRGMNIVIYNTVSQTVYDVINYDLFAGGIFTRFDCDNIKYMQEVSNNLDFMLEYLNALENERYIVLIGVNDDAALNITDEIKQKMYNLGLYLEIETQKSYIGIVNGQECVYNKSSSEQLFYDDFIYGAHIQIQSAGMEAGSPIASIIIDGREYSKNTRGLNVVVYDKLDCRVIDSIAFDLYDKFSANYD